MFMEPVQDLNFHTLLVLLAMQLLFFTYIDWPIVFSSVILFLSCCGLMHSRIVIKKFSSEGYV
jgi:hypothetical protein